MSRNIFVTGDLIVDTNIARLSSKRNSYRDPCPETLLSTELGGAWYLADILEQILPGDDRVIQTPARRNKRQAGKAVSLWEMLPGGADSEDWRWRVSEFMGCERPDAAARLPLDEFEGQSSCDALVLDDVGVAFSDADGPWTSAAAERCLEGASSIFGKTTTLDKPLWKHLLRSEHAAKLTLITNIGTLREMGARVSRALSWDSAIHDLQEEFRDGVVGNLLGECKRVVVLFGSEGVGLFSRVPRDPEDAEPARALHFEQFVYDPVFLEETRTSNQPGKTYGRLSWLTAAMVVADLCPDQFSRFITLCRVLEVLSRFHADGAGSDAAGPHSAAQVVAELKQHFLTPPTEERNKGLPEERFGAAFPHELMDACKLHGPEVKDPTLLTNATGSHVAFIKSRAEEVVLYGPEKALRLVPCAQYGKYGTYDREEIERINSLRNLITDYNAGSQSKPLCVAVFGRPGSGKSFAIKQMARQMFGSSRAEITFNLSQFESVADLHAAFHQVRDMALAGSMPLVFWDEFDSGQGGSKLRWLKDFLAPMQDGEFSEHGRNHPIGRAIFIFAGGTAGSYTEFVQKYADAHEEKAPDFISRLRGYVDIKGPNPTSDNDYLYFIRRALLLRRLLERDFGNTIITTDNRASINPGVLAGLLYVDRYEHGARSMEAVVSHSHLQDAYCFGPSELPPPELLGIHLSEDFLERVERSQYLAAGFADHLARRMHQAWKKRKEADGWTHGKVRDDALKTNPYLLDYDALSAEGQARNLDPARQMVVRLRAFGLSIVPEGSPSADTKRVEQLTDDEVDILAVTEHQRWMRERMIEGYTYGARSCDALRRHRDMRKFEHLPDKTAVLDKDQIQAMFETLKEQGLVLVREGNGQ